MPMINTDRNTSFCIIPLCIFVYDYKKNQLNIETAAMYVVFFMTSGPQSGIDQQIRFRSKGFLYVFRMIDCVEAAFAVQIAAYKSCVAY